MSRVSVVRMDILRQRLVRPYEHVLTCVWHMFKNMCKFQVSWPPLKGLWSNFQVLQISNKEKGNRTFDVISENSSPKGFFWPNKKKSVISLLSADSRYFRTYALKRSEKKTSSKLENLDFRWYSFCENGAIW